MSAKRQHFFIVGAQRSGTTYLYELLDQHPEICMAKPMRPEPKYFMYRTSQLRDASDYIERFFSCCDGARVFGEKSTSYYEREESAELIAEMFPDAKIIFLLRNPTHRALSNYFFSVGNGFEKRTPDEIFGEEWRVPKNPGTVSVNPFDYLGRGEYARFIELYRHYFPNDQIKVILYEEFIGNREAVADLYRFLDVDDGFVPENLATIVNASVKQQKVDDMVLQRIDAYYEAHNAALAKLLNRDLGKWANAHGCEEEGKE